MTTVKAHIRSMLFTWMDAFHSWVTVTWDPAGGVYLTACDINIWHVDVKHRALISCHRRSLVIVCHHSTGRCRWSFIQYLKKKNFILLFSSYFKTITTKKKKASYITCFNLLKMTCWGVTVWVNRYLSLKIWCFCHLFLIQCLVSGLKFSLKPHQPPLSSAVQFTAGFKLLLNLLFKQLQQFLPLGPQETQCSIIKLSPKSITMHTTDPISK